MKGPILIVDASSDRRRVAEMLAEAGFAAVKVSTGRAAVDYLTSSTKPLPSLVLLDVDLPDLGGWQLVQIMRSYFRLASVPVMVVSRAGIDSHSGTAHGVAEIFQKPIYEPVLLHRVRELTGVKAPNAASRGVAESFH